MRELSHVLEAEKSSRSDLELYVAVLGKQKTVMQDEGDKLHKELKDGRSIMYRSTKSRKKETPHSFKGQQLENKLFYLVVIYIEVWGNFLATI